MKTEELKALGLNDEQVQRVFAMNGADVNREKQAAETAKAERDAMRTQLDEANTKLKGYDLDWQQKAADAEQKAAAQDILPSCVKNARHDMIHEYGYALEITLNLIHNEKYIAVRRSGLELSDLSKVVIDGETFTMPITYLANNKFVSIYQGRLYETEDYGIFKPDFFEVDESMLKEYFSEGYRAFYQEATLLKEKDPLLYHFIEELSDDKE